MPENNTHPCYAITDKGTPCTRTGTEVYAHCYSNVARISIPDHYDPIQWSKSRIYLCTQHTNLLNMGTPQSIKLPYMYASRDEMYAAIDNAHNKENNMSTTCISCGTTTTGDRVHAMGGLYNQLVCHPDAPVEDICSTCYEKMGKNIPIPYMGQTLVEDMVCSEFKPFVHDGIMYVKDDCLTCGFSADAHPYDPDMDNDPVHMEDHYNGDAVPTITCGKCKQKHHTTAQVRACHNAPMVQVSRKSGDYYLRNTQVKKIPNPYKGR